MADTFSILTASTNDIPQLVRLMNSAYRGENSKKGWTTEADLLVGELRTDEASLNALFKKPEGVMLKYCEAEETITGCVYLEKQEKKIYLGMLTVSPNVQAQGIGKKLLFASEEYAKKQGCEAITMNVISLRSELINWYIKHGYQRTGEVKPFPEDKRFGIPKQPLEFIVLEKKIS